MPGFFGIGFVVHTRRLREVALRRAQRPALAYAFVMTASFPVSGVEANPLLLLLAAFAIAALTTPAGVSGAFLLLPFQVSILGFTSPAVSPTNLIYNIVSTPGGVYRYAREGRIDGRLAALIALGALPGVFAGAVLRVTVFSDPSRFKAFIGIVLLYLGGKLLSEVLGGKGSTGRTGDRRAVPSASVFALSLAVGVVGGIYSIGGGSIIAPFLVTVFGLPVRAVAGAALLGTFVTSLAGVVFFEALAMSGIGPQSAAVAPDWLLGAVLGIGGLAGSYAGARAQRYLPETWIKAVLGALVALLALGYLYRASL